MPEASERNEDERSTRDKQEKRAKEKERERKGKPSKPQAAWYAAATQRPCMHTAYINVLNTIKKVLYQSLFVYFEDAKNTITLYYIYIIYDINIYIYIYIICREI